MVERGGETNMEKLELLSQTAILKQGIDRTGGSEEEKTSSDEKYENAVLVDSSNHMVTGLPSFSHTQHLLSAAVAAGTGSGSVPPGYTGDKRNRTKPLRPFPVGTTAAVGRNIASPVSTDGEDEEEPGAILRGTSTTSNRIKLSTHNAKACIVESRSPITTLEYGHQVAVGSSPPYPSSPATYGFGLVQNHSHSLNQHQPQEHQEYQVSLYHNQHRSIIRTLSEASFAPPYSNNAMAANSHAGAASTTNSEIGAAFQPPQQQQAAPPRLELQPRHSSEDMARQIRELKEQLSEKDVLVSTLQNRVNCLENQIHELRQLPTGKISHIPVDDMIRIMQVYGSEVSNQTLPQQRKQNIKKASIVRQFRRWNPNFFRFFVHHNGDWVPKLGREGELRRRVEKRRLLLIAKQNQNAGVPGVPRSK